MKNTCFNDGIIVCSRYKVRRDEQEPPARTARLQRRRCGDGTRTASPSATPAVFTTNYIM